MGSTDATKPDRPINTKRSFATCTVSTAATGLSDVISSYSTGFVSSTGGVGSTGSSGGTGTYSFPGGLGIHIVGMPMLS